ncbi:alpha/beta hydrolase [Candidatus Thioglobus sp.]|nr:alpha/beta hydrolase [Candidatus Thioglobus sp.]
MNHLSYKKIGEGMPFVLVHGYLGGQDMWKFQEDLKDHFELIMPSLPGYGESAFMTAPSTIRENAIKVFELLDHLEIDTFCLLGHSMGGMIVQEMAALFPERIKKLICFGTGSIGVLPNRFETIEESRNKIKEVGIKQTRENIAKTWFVNYLFGDGYQLCLDEGAKATTQAALASLDAWESWDGRGQLEKIKSPTLILWSNKDRSYDWNQQEILHQGIPNSKVEIIKDCAHNSHMEKPNLVNQIIREFLS